MKRAFLYIGMGLALLLTLYFFTEDISTELPLSKKIVVSSGSADYPIFDSLEELEADSDLIIKGQLHGDPQIKDEYQSGVHIDSVRKSEVVIREVYKGQREEEEIITVYEPGFVQDNTLITIEGYVPMNSSGNYILFLRENPNGEYVVMGVDQGKYDLNIRKGAKRYTHITFEELENADYIGENPNRFNKLKDQVRKKYN
ncbi:hypothetical protein V1502_10440 [Bacillus sp. SCS-153A]|uniref:hypothetical protein n=1 Tax=Rossellomorea sedimentorum TaxID=3115294 RepID=UPI003905ED20